MDTKFFISGTSPVPTAHDFTKVDGAAVNGQRLESTLLASLHAYK